MSNETDYQSRRQTFDVRALNLTAVSKAIDLEIAIAEADFAIDNIKRQMADQYGDTDWLRDATRACDEIHHKKTLAQKKLDYIHRREATPATTPEIAFSNRFMRVAKRLLPDSGYELLYQTTFDEKAST